MTTQAALDPPHVRLERYARFVLHRLYHIPPREILIADCILDETLAAGRTCACVPLATIVARTGIDARDLKTLPSRQRPGLIARLVRKGILIQHPEADSFSFQPDDTQWTAKRRPIAETAIQEVLQAILAPSRGLSVALGEIGLEAVVRRLFTTPGGQLPLPLGRGELPRPPVVNDHAAGGELPPEPVVNDHGSGGELPRPYNRLPEGTGEPVTGNRFFNDAADTGEVAYLLEKLERLLGGEGPEELERNGARWHKAACEHPASFRFALNALQDHRDARLGFKASAARWFNKVYENKLHNRVPDRAVHHS